MIKLVAIDLDGTLFDSHSNVPEENIKAIQYLSENGVYPVISTGRPLYGIPEALKSLPFAYAITSNGSAVYDLKTNECIFENCIPQDVALEVLDFLSTRHVTVDCFIEGKGISDFRSLEIGQSLPIPEELKKYVLYSRERVESIPAYILNNNKRVQKMTINFCAKENPADGFIDRDEVKQFFESHPALSSCCGGYNNQEITKFGINKGIALRELSKHIGCSIEETMAIGDTENDSSIIETAGIGVAMGNAIPEIKEISNYITASNDEAGVAKAIWNFCLK